MKRSILMAWAIAVLATVAPFAASADVTGTYLLGDGKDPKQTITIHYKDDQHIRMDSGQQGSYLLIVGKKVYAVSNHNGKITAIDMDSMPKFTPPAVEKKPAGKGSFVKTGRSETVAGIKGEVYLADDGAGKKMEVVLASDARAAALSRAFMALAARMGQSLGRETATGIEAALREAKQHGYGALLRSGNHMTLQSLRNATLPAATWQLPPGVTPTAIPGFAGQPGAAGGKPPQLDPAAMQKLQEAMKKMQQQPARQ